MKAVSWKEELCKHFVEFDLEPKLFVCGAAAGDYFGSGDYPTLCPGMNHGRALTFGRLAGILAAGGSIDKVADLEL